MVVGVTRKGEFQLSERAKERLEILIEDIESVICEFFDDGGTIEEIEHYFGNELFVEWAKEVEEHRRRFYEYLKRKREEKKR